MISKEFLLSGDAIFTVIPAPAFRDAVPDSQDHYTFKVERVEFEGPNAKTMYFIKSLAGSDNTSDYVYMGVVDTVFLKGVKLTAKSAFPETSTRVRIASRVVSRILAGDGDKIAEAGWDVKHAGKCGKCGRMLTEPESLSSGIGPICRQALAASRF
jgi:hypothetical protein